MATADIVVVVFFGEMLRLGDVSRSFPAGIPAGDPGVTGAVVLGCLSEKASLKRGGWSVVLSFGCLGFGLLSGSSVESESEGRGETFLGVMASKDACVLLTLSWIRCLELRVAVLGLFWLKRCLNVLP